MKIHEVHQGIVKHKRRKRVGRGIGSGHGKTCGRGHKGQASRSGWSCPPVFEGGQMPLVRRIPKRGFHNAFAPVVATINVSLLEAAFEDGDEVNPQVLCQRGLVKRQFDALKVLGDGQLRKRLKVSAHRFSRSAQEKIQRAGGEAILLPAKVRGPKKKTPAKHKTPS